MADIDQQPPLALRRRDRILGPVENQTAGNMADLAGCQRAGNRRHPIDPRKITRQPCRGERGTEGCFRSFPLAAWPCRTASSGSADTCGRWAQSQRPSPSGPSAAQACGWSASRRPASAPAGASSTRFAVCLLLRPVSSRDSHLRDNEAAHWLPASGSPVQPCQGQQPRALIEYAKMAGINHAAHG